ncbi:MAG TPA: aminoglycoside 6-adenylyltransferase [Hanamia sp.]
MNTNKSIKNKIINYANNDERVRAVILNGSRANPKVTPDKYQDFDILFVVKNFDSFLNDKNWISFLGNSILQQLPDEMILGNDENENKISYAYLMIFEDRNRVDLTLFPKEKFDEFEFDSLTIVWLDKDGLFQNFPEASDKDYYVSKPSQRQFLEVCNEFWWTSTNVAKGLARHEILYAKDMMETFVRRMFMKVIEWKIGYENNWKVSVGKSGKFVKKYLDSTLYDRILKTYSNAILENNWEALFEMIYFFKELQLQIAGKLQFDTNPEEMNSSTEYIKELSRE